MTQKPKKKTSLGVWLVMGVLIFALGGFGIGNFGGSVRSIGAVGDTEVPVTEYALSLQNALRQRAATTGEAVSLASPEGQRIAEQVRTQLLNGAAIENETTRLGLSVGDERVRREVLNNPAFVGLDGGFDREGYAFMLRQNGLSEREYEESIRTEAASNLTTAAVLAGLEPHDTAVDLLAGFLGERRNILWLRLDRTALTEPLPEPTDAQLQQYYDENPDFYTEPEKKQLTYVALTPESLVETLEVSEYALRTRYEERSTEYNRPERRLVERLVFPDQQAAEAARAALDDGGATFESLVTGRGLTLPDVDLGDVTQEDLGSAGEAVFALDGPGIVGPVETSLGSALLRVNAILQAQTTPFEEVREELIDELALDQARRAIGGMREEIDDLLAAGATLEEVAAETDMELGTIDFGPDTADGIAGYAAFRDAAEAVELDDFPELLELEDGGLFALRLDTLLPPALLPFEDVEARVRVDWQAAETEDRLLALAEEIRDARQGGESYEALGYTPEARDDLARESFLDGAPGAMIGTIFGMEPGGIDIMSGDGEMHLVELTGVVPEDPEDPENQAMRVAISQSLGRDLATDALSLFIAAARADAGISLNQTAINAVHAQLP